MPFIRIVHQPAPTHDEHYRFTPTMHFLDLTLPSLAENLALDEALLIAAEQGGPELLRVWHWPSYAVVLGAGGRIADDVDAERCAADGVPLGRRSSGGGTVLLGPGCLLYSVVLAYAREPALTQIRSSYGYVLGRLAAGLASVAPDLAVRGSSDLAQLDRKLSGNAQQRKRTHLLQHGTLLDAFDLDRIGRYLKPPPRQPEYRQQRSHRDFVMNFGVGVDVLTRCLRKAWDAQESLGTVPAALVQQLVADKYGKDEWIYRF